ncbi:TonB-dependent receptor plug domain-containing protein [Ensifer sp. 1H6]|uniref:TonB-dependent receptor plug domain-containing protein n=1 Tax=Ensifer sp. 1H6 TaxID=1911585 RepID=UPI001FDA7714|nr:TonB-dependent receptor plug domain-containing protein [Ensifer sp. 1H6]
MLNRHRRLALLACTTTLALSAASGAFAQTATTAPKANEQNAEAAKKGETFLSPIVVKGARTSDPYAKAGPVSVVTTDQIDLQSGLETDDLLRGVPGTSTANNPQNPGVAVNIRGFEGSGRVNMMIDGVRQNFRFTGHEAQGLAYFDPAFLSEIDVTRGASPVSAVAHWPARSTLGPMTSKT